MKRINFTDSDIDILKKAHLYWNKRKRFQLLIEELSELITAVSHSFRTNKNNKYNFLEEFADVCIMLQDCILYFDENEINQINKIRKKKLKKVLKYMELKNESNKFYKTTES